MKVGIIAGSIREGRKGIKVAKWLTDLAQSRDEAQSGEVEYQLIDLKQFDVPLLTDNLLPGQRKKQYLSAETQAWSDAIDSCDGFVFVMPEYNHSVPGAFKNAVDSLGPEWTGKPVAFASYGSVGGVRATEHWRGIVANFSMLDQRAALDFNVFSEFDADGNFTPLERKTEDAQGMFDALGSALKMVEAAK